MIKQRPFTCQPALVAATLGLGLLCQIPAKAQPPAALGRQWQEKKEAKLDNPSQQPGAAAALGPRLRQLLPPPAAAKPALGPQQPDLPLTMPDFASRRAAQAPPGWTIVRDPGNGLPVSMDNYNPHPRAKPLVRPAITKPQKAARDFIATHAQFFGLEDHQTELVHHQTTTGPLGQHHVVFYPAMRRTAGLGLQSGRPPRPLWAAPCF